MPANQLLQKLAEVYRGDDIQYQELKAVTLAQWMLESGRATSKLAKLHYNFGGLKWRREMVPYATRIEYEAHDGVDFYCKFATVENFISGYWAWLGGTRRNARGLHPVYRTDLHADEELREQGSRSGSGGEGTAGAGAGAGDGGRRRRDRRGGGRPRHHRHRSRSRRHREPSGQFRQQRDQQERRQGKETHPGFLSDPARRTVAAGFQCRRNHQCRSHPDDGRQSCRRKPRPIGFHQPRQAVSLPAFQRLVERLHQRNGNLFRAAANTNLNLADDIAFATDVHKALFGAFKAMDAGAKDRGVKPDTEWDPAASAS